MRGSGSGFKRMLKQRGVPARREQAIVDGKQVLKSESAALDTLADTIAESFADAVELIISTSGRLVVAGVGKSGHIGRKISATFASTGTPSYFVHATEASHGDLGMIVSNDTCLLLSKSGETSELIDIISYTRRFGIKLISITSNRYSTLAQKSDIALVLPEVPEVCAIGMAPTTSTTLSLALGDALAVAVMRQKGFALEGFHTFHPGGKLGAQFLKVEQLMQKGDALPLVDENDRMTDVLVRMTGAGYGVAVVVKEAILTGVITDGDLRRNMDVLMISTAGEVATRHPKSISPDALVSEAVHIMNANKINVLCVTSDSGELKGIIRLHDCLAAGVM